MMRTTLVSVLVSAAVTSAFQPISRTQTRPLVVKRSAPWKRCVSLKEVPQFGNQPLNNRSLDFGKEVLSENSRQATLGILQEGENSSSSYSFQSTTAKTAKYGEGSLQGSSSINTKISTANATLDTVNNVLEVAVEFFLEPETSEADESVSDTVNKILAVSEEAVVAAEATLSEDVASRLKTFPSNDTAKAGSVITEILPASSVVGDSVAVDKIEAPSISKIIRFAIPATGVWLCSPLLSLIDTSTVGIFSGTIQQAALNPAVAVTEYTALLIAFLYTGTTNLIAAAREQDRGVDGSPRTTSKVVGAVQLSTYVGVGMGAFLFAFAGPLVRIIVGKGDLSPAVIEAAIRYVRIRALGMPAAAMIGTAQAACLGMQDAKSPLYVLLAAAVVNFLGDMLFVGNSNPWVGGAAGAAWATTFSQYVAVGLFVHWLCNKPKQEQKPKTINISNSIMKMMDKAAPIRDAARDSKIASRGLAARARNLLRPKTHASAAPKATLPYKGKEKAFSSRGFLEGRIKKRDLVKFPSKTIAKEFSPYVLPVTATQLGRVSSYVAMSHVISSSLGTLAMAAQQVILSFFYSFAPIADSLSLTAQSFVPSIAEKRPSKARAAALRKTMNNLAKVAIVFAGFMVALTAGIPLFSYFSTSDMNVISLVTSVSPYMIGVSMIHSTIIAFEGILLGRKDLNFVGKMYALWFFGVPYFMLRVKRAALAGQPVGLGSVWKVFLWYNVVRAVSWVGRMLVIQKRTERDAGHLG